MFRAVVARRKADADIDIATGFSLNELGSCGDVTEPMGPLPLQDPDQYVQSAWFVSPKELQKAGWYHTCSSGKST
jgi:hypothetical protein